MYNDYAVVLPEEAVYTLSEGKLQGRIAVCVVRDAVSETHIIWPSEVDRLAKGLPRVPSKSGYPVALLDFDEEMEVLAAIEEAVRAEAVRLTFGAPPSFMEAGSILTAGLSMMFQDVGVDVRISPLLAQKIRWKEGDQIRLSTTVDGRIGCIFCEESGTSLIPSEAESGHLEVSSYLPYPSFLGELFTDWQSIQYWIADGRIFFDLEKLGDEVSPSSSLDEVEEEVASPTNLPERSPLFSTDVLLGLGTGALFTSAIAVFAKLALT
jgi:hypothetical protein